jgi:hypothetical protein
VFKIRTVRTSRPDSSSLYCITTREIVGISWRLLFGILGFLSVANVTQTAPGETIEESSNWNIARNLAALPSSAIAG